MKHIVLAIALFGSLGSMAAAKIMLNSDDYSTEAILTAGESIMAGSIANETEHYGRCEGSYSILQGFISTTIKIDFPTEDCHLQSMDVVVNNIYYLPLMGGSEVPVVYKQLEFGSAEKAGMLKMISRD